MKELGTKYSEIYELDGKKFQYNYTDSIVEYIYVLEEDEEMLGHKGDIFEMDAAGLKRENWENKRLRDMYLREWIMELDENARYLAKEVEEEFGGMI